MWSFADVAFDLQNEGTDDPVVTVQVTTPSGVLYVMAELVLSERTMVLRGAHMHGDGVGPNTIGSANLIVLAHAAMEEMEAATTRTALWAVAQLKELHPVFFAHLQAAHNRLPGDAADETDEEIIVSTGQAMSL